MSELKKLQLNNKSLDEFDTLMGYHLDKIEELEIDEININSRLYNLISLCTNLKQLVIKGDLRSDVNKIFFNICNPENIETLVLESVKLPTTKALSKFSNLSTISLNNINFSDLAGFLDRIPSPEKIIALNFTNVDFGKRPISICSKFENLKYLNLDNLKNCVFDSFDFINKPKKVSRFEFCNNEIDFELASKLLRGKHNKKIEIDLKTSKNCGISNSLEIINDEISLTVNSCDLEKAIESISVFRLTNLFIILDNQAELDQYIKKFNKSRAKVTLAINDIAYFNIGDAKKFQDRLGVEFVSVLESPNPVKLTDCVQCYAIDDYIQMREEFEKIQSEFIASRSNNFERFQELYNYFRNNIKYSQKETDLKQVFVEKKASYNYYALAINSCLKVLGFESKVIRGNLGEEENRLWNQVKINDDWYNFDVAYELKGNKKLLQNSLKSILLSDEEFYKTHTPYLYCKPKICNIEWQEAKKEIKKEQKKENIKKESIWKRIYQKLVSIFKFNKDKALPAPEEDKK